jgi:hypothetical protein
VLAASAVTVLVAATPPAGASGVCPVDWTCTDVGGALPPGQATLANGTLDAVGGGYDLFGTADSFYFVSQPLNGDGTVTAHVTSLVPTDPDALAGVTLRASTDPGSPYFGEFITPGVGLVIQWRATQGGQTTEFRASGTAPVYLRVSRYTTTGSAPQTYFAAFTSADGTTWTRVPGTTVVLNMPSSLLGGVAITSHDLESSGMAVTMDTLSVAAGEFPGPDLICPNGWNCTDVGNVTPAGGQDLSGGQWTVMGGGPDIWETTDAFHYVWQYLAPNGTVSAQVTSFSAADPWAKAGLMVRGSTAANAPYYAVYVTAGNGIVVQARPSAGAEAIEPTTALVGTAPEYLRITQSGSSYTAWTSPNGTAWTPIPGSTFSLTTSGPVVGGLAVTSHDLTALVTAGFDAVHVTGTVLPTTTTASVDPTAVTSGGSVSYSATVVPTSGVGTPTGTVTFTAGTTTLCSAGVTNRSASCSSTNAPLGSDTVTATYSGDGNFSGSNGSAVLTVTSLPLPPPTVADGTLAAPVVGMASLPDGRGYWLADAQGAVSAHGDAVSYGSMAGKPLNSPIAHIVGTPDGLGYWLVAGDGGTFAFGDAGFFGSMGGQHLNAPVVDLAPTADGQGYWLVASDGGIFAFGDAHFHGSMGGSHLNQPVVGISADYATGGYWEVATDGGIFSFGAPFFGSTGAIHLNQPVNGITTTTDFQGYRFVASDGGIFSFGAPFYGSMGGQPLNAPVVGMAADPATGGYWLVASDGGIFNFGAPFYGAN